MQEVLVRRLNTDGKTLYHSEILMLLIVRHDTIILLYGYCARGAYRVVVYDFVACGTSEQGRSGIFGGPGRELFTVKDDIYSYGILSLELISGSLTRLFIIGERHNFDWAEARCFKDIIDEKINAPEDQLSGLVVILKSCISADPDYRPSIHGVAIVMRNLIRRSTSDKIEGKKLRQAPSIEVSN
ncbi:PREDICTED: probable serine/threonine-protein kinase NAK [Erythranthe guttata]|uniref:probable serine/threonine-protein kinase NAK n=1 Tax=Erythranthe guttata TaxID=4155 RepID=UPI00064E102D|nr:PREDICTED: probable serine/threonine-protein kinase NAK [Erythranthe guttata]|eukprot:XP_012852586.1 PREDICTED: probable serine/threonine-protein kinase NAK [Erythranthe guttata]